MPSFMPGLRAGQSEARPYDQKKDSDKHPGAPPERVPLLPEWEMHGVRKCLPRTQRKQVRAG